MEVLYWFLMNVEVKDYICQGSICQFYQLDQCHKDHPYLVPYCSVQMLDQQKFFTLVGYWSGVGSLRVSKQGGYINGCDSCMLRPACPTWDTKCVNYRYWNSVYTISIENIHEAVQLLMHPNAESPCRSRKRKRVI